MKSIKPEVRESPSPQMRLIWILAIGCALIVLISWFKPRPARPAGSASASESANPTAMAADHSRRGWSFLASREPAPPPRSAAEIVAEKMNQFARGRAEIVAALARRYNVTIPEEVHRFFAAAQAGRWEETTNLFASLNQFRQSTNRPPGLERLWPAIVETYGVAEQKQIWPAQQLLDYGHAVLESLRPGMIYLGGNDAGRFIPALLTDTSGGEPHVVLTQNALADVSYLDYVRFLYGDRLNTLSAEDSQKCFQDYLADAQQRLLHDQQFPDQARQVRPGEDIRITEGRVQVSGQLAVMSINELLLQTLLDKNPDRAFALTESFPLKSLYGEATTLGCVTELRTSDSAVALTPERARQSLDYWHNAIQSLPAGSEDSGTVRAAYAKLILGQAGLFEDRRLTSQTEQAYQLALHLTPGNAEAVFRYVNLLMQQQRLDDARQVVRTALATTPDNAQFADVLTRLNRPQ